MSLSLSLDILHTDWSLFQMTRQRPSYSIDTFFANTQYGLCKPFWTLIDLNFHGICKWNRQALICSKHFEDHGCYHELCRLLGKINVHRQNLFLLGPGKKRTGTPCEPQTSISDNRMCLKSLFLETPEEFCLLKGQSSLIHSLKERDRERKGADWTGGNSPVERAVCK